MTYAVNAGQRSSEFATEPHPECCTRRYRMFHTDNGCSTRPHTPAQIPGGSSNCRHPGLPSIRHSHNWHPDRRNNPGNRTSSELPDPQFRRDNLPRSRNSPHGVVDRRHNGSPRNNGRPDSNDKWAGNRNTDQSNSHTVPVAGDFVPGATGPGIHAVTGIARSGSGVANFHSATVIAVAARPDCACTELHALVVIESAAVVELAKAFAP